MYSVDCYSVIVSHSSVTCVTNCYSYPAGVSFRKLKLLNPIKALKI